MRHGGITGFEVNIVLDGGISEPGTGPSTRNTQLVIISTLFVLIFIRWLDIL
jgi:hypothetical protein